MRERIGPTHRKVKALRAGPGITVALAFALRVIPEAKAADEVQFNRDIRPIIAENCVKCHGPDADGRKAELRLDQWESAKDVLEPGEPEASELYRRITAEASDDLMPPPESGKQLTSSEIATLRRWIDQGAGWQRHWAFVPPERPEIPDVQNDEWVRNPIDAFVLSRLEEKGFEPAPQADRETLIRRLSLDLIGLPPKVHEVEAFVNDDRPDAYARLVDRLLSSPHLGERWGRHWLDVARYADSEGFLGDELRPHAWRYRDWVINAINEDMPFDTFTIQQLAGDLLPDPSTRERVATGFNRNAPHNMEAGVNKVKARANMVKDRVDTTATAWLGLTLECSKCHTHKYDPITIEDYYQFYAFFNNTVDRDIEAPTEATVSDFKKSMEKWQRKSKRLHEKVESYEVGPLKRNFREWMAEGEFAERGWRIARPADINAREGAALETRGDGFIDVSEEGAEKNVYEVDITLDSLDLERPVTAIRLEVGEGSRFPRLDVPGAPGGKAGDTAIEFRRSSKRYVDVGRLGDFGSRLDQGVTVSAWMKSTSDKRMFITGAVNKKQQLLFLNVNEEPGSGKIRAFLRTEDGKGLGATTPSDAGVTDGKWHHVAAVWESAEPRVVLYVDGEMVHEAGKGNEPLTEGWVNWDVPLFIGAVNLRGEPTDDYFDGTLDRVAIWDRPLTPSEIQRHLESEDQIKAVREDNLIALWDFNETSGRKLADGARGNFPGTVVQGEERPFVLTGLSVSTVSQGDEDKDPVDVSVQGAKASTARHGYSVDLALDGADKSGWSVRQGDYRPQAATFKLGEPISVRGATEQDTRLRIRLAQEHGDGQLLRRFRVSVTDRNDPLQGPILPERVADLLRERPQASEAPRKQGQAELFRFYQSYDSKYRELTRRLAEHKAAKPEPPDTKAQALAQRSDRRETYVHIRGDPTRRGDAVRPAALSVLPPIESERDEPNRLDLARWLFDPENPLTARVAANRIWGHLFGQGLVRTPSDFGTRGELPTHPKLLDWLATEYRKVGWSRKEMIRQIVTSSTYRQLSRFRPKLEQVDPLNRLLARQNRFRLEAEIVWDSFLAASGLLNRDIGGESIRPPLPPDVSGIGRDVAWPVSEGDKRYKRGMYILLRRSVQYPMLTTFDAPDASQACVKRDRSNTPLQALTLMNGPVFFKAAQSLGIRIAKEASDNPETRLKLLFRRCLAREPTDDELARLMEFYRAQKDLVKARGKEALEVLEGWDRSALQGQDAVEVATLISIARIVMNLDEFQTRG